MGVCLF